MKLPQLHLRDVFWLVLVVVLAFALVVQDRRWSAANHNLVEERAAAMEAERTRDKRVETTQQSQLPIAASAAVPTFEITLKPQRALFYTQDWVGAAGHPVHTSAKFIPSGTLRMGDRQILLEHDTRKLLVDRAGMRPNTSIDTMLVDADIHLEPAWGDQSTDPPTTVQIYAVKIDKLHSVHWQPK